MKLFSANADMLIIKRCPGNPVSVFCQKLIFVILQLALRFLQIHY